MGIGNLSYPSKLILYLHQYGVASHDSEFHFQIKCLIFFLCLVPNLDLQAH